MTRRLK